MFGTVALLVAAVLLTGQIAVASVCGLEFLEGTIVEGPDNWRTYTTTSSASDLDRAIDVFSLPRSGDTFTYRRFIDDLRRQTTIEPIEILRASRWEFRRIEPIFRAVLDERIGDIGPVSCSDASLFSLHNDQHSTLPNGELAALELAKDGQLKVYFFSTDRYGFSITPIEPFLRVDLSDGWIFRAFLHSHPFEVRDERTRGGLVLPSNKDIIEFTRLKASYGLLNARITNGISTLSFSSTELEMLPIDACPQSPRWCEH